MTRVLRAHQWSWSRMSAVYFPPGTPILAMQHSALYEFNFGWPADLSLRRPSLPLEPTSPSRGIDVI
jgi:hypothetical protein